jgi:lipid A 4'-phosphatase
LLTPANHKPLWIGLALFFSLLALFWLTDLDLRLVRLAFHANTPHWPAQNIPPWSWLYLYGEAPGLLLGAGSLLLFFLSFFKPRLKPYRGQALYLALVLIVGSGLIVNVFCKNLLGRPRPEQVAEFGGFWEYLKPFQAGIPGRGQSLLSGHASVAFYFLCLYFLLPEKKRWPGLALGLVYGGLMGTARVLQGAHFPSDVLLAGVMMFWVSALLQPLITWQPRRSFFQKAKVKAGLAGILLGLLLVGFPVFEERHYIFMDAGETEPRFHNSTQRFFDRPAGAPIDEIIFSLELETGDVAVHFQETDHPLMIQEIFKGAGLGPAGVDLVLGDRAETGRSKASNRLLHIQLAQKIKGFFYSRQAQYEILLTSRWPVDAKVVTAKGTIQVDPFPKNAKILLTGNFDLDSLPEGFQAFGRQTFYRQGEGNLKVLNLQGKQIIFLR